MSRPAAPATPAAHGHGPGHGHHHPPAPAAGLLVGTPRATLPSLLMAGVGARLLGVAVLLLLLWAAVAWALGEPA